jgi:hypothetical protein
MAAAAPEPTIFFKVSVLVKITAGIALLRGLLEML